jgi:hypothetical protein
VSRVEGHKSRVEGHWSRFESRGRGSKVEVEGQKSRSRVKSRGPGSKVEVEGQKSRSRVKIRGSKVEIEGQKSRSRVKSRRSKVENTNFLSILQVLQPLNAAKQLVSLSKLKNFAHGYAVWLCTV